MAHQVPRLADPPKDRVLELQDGLQEVRDWAADNFTALISFMRETHDHGDPPRGPVLVSAAFRAVCPIITWRNEASNAIVDFFAIYRAPAGTAGVPTTPGFDLAKRINVVPSGRVPRQLPVGSYFTYADLDFSAAEAAANNRFSYWITAIDNLYRESTPIPMGIVQV